MTKQQQCALNSFIHCVEVKVTCLQINSKLLNNLVFNQAIPKAAT